MSSNNTVGPASADRLLSDRPEGTTGPLKRTLLIAIASAALIAGAGSASAQTTRPAGELSLLVPAPMIRCLSDESQALFDELRPGLVGVQLPPPSWLVAAMDLHSPVKKWDKRVDPAVLRKLDEFIKTSRPSKLDVKISPATQPGRSGTPQAPTEPPPPGVRSLRVVPRPEGGIDLVPGPMVADRESTVIGPGSIGLVIDGAGHIAVPYFVEKEDVGEKPVRLFLEGNRFARAHFVGSDQKTNLTVLKLEDPETLALKPLRLATGRPADGSIVMALSASGEAGQWIIWTGGVQESSVIVNASGEIAGFTRHGQFLSSDYARPVLDQLIRTGTVKRAVLGVVIVQGEGPTGRLALQIHQITPGSAAEQAGLKTGDFIVSVSGEPVADLPSFAGAIAGSSGPTEIDVLREGKTLKLTAELQPQ